MPQFPRFIENQPKPIEQNTMINGAASRILYGDPAFKPQSKVDISPFNISFQEEDFGFKLICSVVDTRVWAWGIDVFHSGLGGNRYMNDKLYFSTRIPDSIEEIEEVRMIKAEAGGKNIENNENSSSNSSTGCCRF